MVEKLRNFIDSIFGNTVRKSSSKRSLMVRWAFANTIFCFFAFTLFGALVYQMSMTAISGEQRSNLISSMDRVESALSKSSTPLTAENLSSYVLFPADNSTTTGSKPDIQTLSNLIGNQKYFYIYDNNGKLIYSNVKHTFGWRDLPENQVSIISGQYSGFLAERQITSSTTGQKIGKIQGFYNMNLYQKVQYRMIVGLVIFEILAIIVALFVGYFIARRYIYPLEILNFSMKERVNTPAEEFSPVEIQTGDEIEELANIYNSLMGKMNDYILAQQQFVSDVSHELRTPITVIEGHLRLLNRWGKDDPDILDESLQAGLEETKRMKGMLEDMLALSRLRHIETEHQNAVSDLKISCEHTVENFLMIHPQLDIAFENLSQNSEAKIFKNHFEQALTILIDNAIKYSPEDRKHIRVELAEDKDYLITSVIDSGLGINQEDISHIFERFFRADKSRNRDIGGTGLGLSIISRIVENYKGKIEVTSELGEGSTFILKIPKVK